MNQKLATRSFTIVILLSLISGMILFSGSLSTAVAQLDHTPTPTEEGKAPEPCEPDCGGPPPSPGAPSPTPYMTWVPTNTPVATSIPPTTAPPTTAPPTATPAPINTQGPFLVLPRPECVHNINLNGNIVHNVSLTLDITIYIIDGFVKYPFFWIYDTNLSDIEYMIGPGVFTINKEEWKADGSLEVDVDIQYSIAGINPVMIYGNQTCNFVYTISSSNFFTSPPDEAPTPTPDTSRATLIPTATATPNKTECLECK